jgi:hypothetical protein
MPAPKDPVKKEEWRKKIGAANAGKPCSDETKKKLSDATKTRPPASKETRKKLSESKKGENNSMFGKHLSDETKQKISASHKGEKSYLFGTHLSDETKQKISDAKKGENHQMFGKHLSDETKQKISDANIGKIFSKETRKKMSDKRKGTHPSKETRKKMSDQRKGENHPNFGKILSKETRKKLSEANKGKRLSDETKEKISNTTKGKCFSETTRQKIVEYQRGGFWYGAVTYFEGKPYCELWTKNLLIRIRAYGGNKSILSGKTKADNNGRELSCHHVYGQKKACCVWDEDAQGYYAMIDGERYYIKGDPNKFVVLTSEEHGWVKKDKLKWIKIFEDIIEKQGGKCYYTKEEWKEIKSSERNQIVAQTRYSISHGAVAA